MLLHKDCLSSDQTIMKDRWINMGYEDKELRPYKEPSKDDLDQGRIGKCGHALARSLFASVPCLWYFLGNSSLKSKLQVFLNDIGQF